MSEKIKTNEAPNLRDRALKLGATLSSIVALASGNPEGQASVTKESLLPATPATMLAPELTVLEKTTQQELRPPRQKSIAELPGFGMEVNDTQRQALIDSTVKIVFQHKNHPEWWWPPSCTGTKITAGGRNYITTAAHCFSEITHNKEGRLVKGEGKYRNEKRKALNFLTPEQPYRYAISDAQDPNLPHNPYQTELMANVKGISVSMEGKDYALLSIDEESIVVPEKSRSSRYFEELKPLPYRLAYSQPLRGQQAALYSIPEYKYENRAVGGTGIYLGRIIEDPLIRYDVVAIGPKDVHEDECWFGASGSSAILADNHVLGPLARRVTIGYGPDRKVYKPDKKSPFAWQLTEYELGVRIPTNKFNTLCFFEVPKRDTVSHLITGLNNFPTRKS